MLRNFLVSLYGVSFFFCSITKLDIFISLLIYIPILFFTHYLSLIRIIVVIFLLCLGIVFSYFSPYDSIWIKVSFISNFISLSLIFFNRKFLAKYFGKDIELVVKINFFMYFSIFLLVYITHLILNIPIRGIWELVSDFTGKSVNYYVSYILVPLAFLIIVRAKDSALWTGGIVVSIYFISLTDSRAVIPFVLFSFIYLYFIYSKKNTLTLLTSVFIFVAFFGASAYYFTDFVNYFSESRIATKGVDSPRGAMLEQYLLVSTSNMLSFIFGGDFYLSKIITSYGYNPHNSIIRLHSALGMFGLFLMAAYLTMIVFFSKRILLLYFIILIVFIRAPLDSVMLFTPLDILIFLVLTCVGCTSEGQLYNKNRENS